MKIKDIRHYRTLYKNERGEDKKDEHFVGTHRIEEGQTRNGWFSIYHGDKEGKDSEDGIKKFLRSYLDMASDSQAVYEFLQNAVDAKASRFAMFWGKDEVDQQYYLLVVNNGIMFDTKSIRSILNVGASTKEESSSAIGKFGIGFKLAHRLVGKQEGLEELLGSEPSGPILFSWKNGELHQLTDVTSIEPVSDGAETWQDFDSGTTGDLPWLLKMLVTCFPVMPENDVAPDMVIMANGRDRSDKYFKRSELLAFGRWIGKYRELLPEEEYREGSAFLIQLGNNKHIEIGNDKLREGLRFSLGIISESLLRNTDSNSRLYHVQLNRDKPVEKPEMNYHQFQWSKESNSNELAFIYFDNDNFDDLDEKQKQDLDQKDNINVLFGYRDYDQIGDFFKGVPNFYLFFPLSEEVHNFNYILHCNAFYKASSRTFLQPGISESSETGLNERLFELIVSRLEKEMMALYEEGKKQEFLNLYAALLTSKKANSQRLDWVNNAFTQKVDKMLGKMTPVRSDMNEQDFRLTKGEVKFKNTLLNLNADDWGIAKLDWFYWDRSAPKEIRESAFEKLSLRKAGIQNFLNLENSAFTLNRYIQENQGSIIIILNELQFIEASEIKRKENLQSLTLFQFDDGCILSDQDLIEKHKHGYIPLVKGLFEIKHILSKMGLIVGTLDLDRYQFYNKYNSFLNSEGIFRQLKRFVVAVNCGDSTKLNTKEKLQIFSALRDLSDESRKDRLSSLKLFRNISNHIVPLQEILRIDNQKWMSKFAIHPDEENESLRPYTISTREDVYLKLIINQWPVLGKWILESTEKERLEIVADIVQFYKNSNEYEPPKLSEKSNYLLFDNEFQQVESPYWNDSLTNYTSDIYISLQRVLSRKVGIHIPDFQYKWIYELTPFGSFDLELVIEDFTDIEFAYDELHALMSFIHEINISNKKGLNFHKIGENWKFNLSERKSCYSQNKKIREYIDKYHSNELILWPMDFGTYQNNAHYTGEALVEFLIDKLKDIGDPDRIEEVLEFIGNYSEDLRNKFLNTVARIDLYTNALQSRTNENWIQVLASVDRSVSDEAHRKIVFQTTHGVISINNLKDSNDTVYTELFEKRCEVHLADLLQYEKDERLFEVSGLLEKLKNQDLVNERTFRLLFGAKTRNLEKEDIDKIASTLKDRCLNNVQQLICVLAYSQFEADVLREFQVENQLGDKIDLTGVLLLPSATSNIYYNGAFILSNKYEGIENFLPYSNQFKFWGFGLDNESSGEYGLRLTAGFQFETWCPIKVFRSNLESEEHAELLDFLFDVWNKRSLTTLIEVLDWSDVFGLSLDEMIVGRPKLSSEKVPEQIGEWIEGKLIMVYPMLAALGIQMQESGVIKLRKILLGQIQNESRIDFSDIPITLLKNTLKGLSGAFEELVSPILLDVDDTRFNLVLSIYEHLVQEGQDLSDCHVLLDRPVKQTILSASTLTDIYHLSDERAYVRLDEGVFEDSSKDPRLLIGILHRSLLKFDDIRSTSQNLDLEFVFDSKNQNCIEEHNEPFYGDWSKKNNLRLLKCDGITYELLVNVEDTNESFGLVSYSEWYVTKDEGYSLLYYSRNLPLQTLRNELEETQNHGLSEAVASYLNQIDNLMKGVFQVMNETGLDSLDDHFAGFKELLAKENVKLKRQSIHETIGRTAKYSYQWFISWIEYMQTFEHAESSTEQKSISFQSVKPYEINGIPSSRFLLLEGANSLISPSIEEASDFDLTLSFSNKPPERIRVEGVTKRHQNLIAHLESDLNQNLLKRLSDSFNAAIRFTPNLELLTMLYNAFKNPSILNPWNDIKEHLPSIHFIYGPPGTGKTTKLKELIIDNCLKRPNYKFLVVVPTNKAGDVLAERIIQENKSLDIVRLGKVTNAELAYENPDLYVNSLNDIRLDGLNVLITTVHRIPYYQVDSQENPSFKLFESHARFDRVLFDESSMIPLHYAVFALMSLNPREGFIVAGDPKQIPPVVDATDSELEKLIDIEENIYSMLGLSSFNPEVQKSIMREGDTIENLPVQFRSIKEIGELFNRYAYEGLLKHGRDFQKKPIKEFSKPVPSILGNRLSIIDVPLTADNSVTSVKKLLYSSYHTYSAILVAELVKYFDSLASKDNPFKIGIISPYKAQALIVKRLIDAIITEPINKLICDTVHGFQGDECDIILFIVNPNKTEHSTSSRSLLNKEYIYNVAMSRAQDQLFFIYPSSSLENPHINRIKRFGIVDGKEEADFHLISAYEIEELIFDKKDFIISNSFVSGHNNINVFSQNNMKYFLKANNTTVDIQLPLIQSRHNVV